jgi:enoyl-CoA hydratase/carnithine racemase
MPFAAARRDGVLTLTLDTPHSPINVFNTATAEQLTEILAAVDPATTRAIVFESAKPNSFINGVGLLLAHASQAIEDIVRASTAPWTAYRAVREAPVPTIAVVQGNCFGCGVEFALNCDFRIAVDTCETRFYMTELHDYLFIPLFGSTWNLPAAVGLADAVDLLLWGERWSAPTAGARGLVDAVAPYAERAAHVETFIARVCAGTQRSRRRGRIAWSAHEAAVVAAARRRIADLPPLYHRVYEHGLELLERGARQGRTFTEHQAHELRYAAESAVSPLGKAAYSFFYVRQMASERAAGRVLDADAPVALAVEPGSDPAAQRFAADLRARVLPDAPDGATGGATCRLVAAGALRNGHGSAAHFATAPAPMTLALHAAFAARPDAPLALYAPAYPAARLLELAIGAGAAAAGAAAARVARTLQRLGFEVARTAPTDSFVSTRLLVALLGPLVRWVAHGGTVRDVNGTLRQLGFARRPHAWLGSVVGPALTALLVDDTGLGEAAVAAALAALAADPAYTGAPQSEALGDALCVSLAGAALRVRDRGEARDPSIIDLIARELLDFPRHASSLCTWLTRARVGRAAADAAAIAALVPPAALEAARAFAAGGRELYRQRTR